jgi:sirohydrochlorin ferrochelatase
MIARMTSNGFRARPEDIGLVVVDHGSRRTESNEMLEQMADMIREVVPYRVVEPAHMELAEPSIATAYGKCVDAGVDLVVVSPYFLLPGRHWSQDIPELAREASEAHPGSRFLVTAPLGLHPLMAQVVGSRVEHCLARAEGQAEECEACAGTGVCAMQVALPA